MKIAIASDHGGYELKQAIIAYLTNKGFEVSDLGTDNSEVSVDYPHYAKKVAHAIINKEVANGILVCGTGIGMSIAANKVPGIRAAVVGDVFSARATKEHNNANIICLGQRVLGEGVALMIVDEWLSADFLGNRHQTRIDLIEEV